MKNLLLIFSFILSLFLSGCEKKLYPFAIKLLLLTPENYINKPLTFYGEVKNIGNAGLWFVLEDKTGFIEVTTENISFDIPCIKKGKKIYFTGQLKQQEDFKYISLLSLLRCEG